MCNECLTLNASQFFSKEFELLCLASTFSFLILVHLAQIMDPTVALLLLYCHHLTDKLYV